MVLSRSWYGSHSFLNDYILLNKCRMIMEIGVADGENAKNMVITASNNFPVWEVEYYGFDIFGWNGDSHMNRVMTKLKATGCIFKLFKGDSTITLPEVVENPPMMDLIFIDGGHSYPTVIRDWENSKNLMHDETAVFFHNYNFSGPKRVVDGISRDEYDVKIIYPPSNSFTALVKKKFQGKNNKKQNRKTVKK